MLAELRTPNIWMNFSLPPVHCRMFDVLGVKISTLPVTVHVSTDATMHPSCQNISRSPFPFPPFIYSLKRSDLRIQNYRA